MAALQAVLNNAEDPVALARVLGLIFLADGLVRWDIRDDDGAPIPLAAALDGSLSWEETVYPIADEADRLYAESVLAPFRKVKVPTSSPTGPTDDSTSAKQES